MSTNTQREHFEEVHDRYQDHYYDEYSNYYREKVLIAKFRHLFADRASILEIGCGGGSNFKNLRSFGLINGTYLALDISPKAVADFNETAVDFDGVSALVCDFTQKQLKLGQQFDLILFLGVLHHMTNDLENVMQNVSSHLNDGGCVLFLEPNAHFLNSIRKFWYRNSDDFDHSNERALTADEIDFYAEKNALTSLGGQYFGNAGFFLILQSMILRTPKWLKRLLCRKLTSFDLLMERSRSKYLLAAMMRIYVKN